MPWEEFRASEMTQDRHAHVIILDNEGGTRFDLVRRCREVFGRGSIRTLAPYAEALRAYFCGQGLAKPDEDLLAVDDLGDRVLLTVFWKGRAGVTRVILPQDPVGIMDEIRRTRKSVQEKGPAIGESRELRILSNHAGLKDAVFFETRFPAFEVLGRVKFPLLMLPEEAAEKKKHGRRVEFFKACLLALLMGGAGAGIFGYAGHAADDIDVRLNQLSLERSALENELRAIGRLTYRSSVKRLPSINFAEVFGKFMDSAPTDSQLVSVLFQRGRDSTWDLTGTVMFPRQEIFPFAAHGAFAGAVLEDIQFQGKPGLRICLRLPEERKVD